MKGRLLGAEFPIEDSGPRAVEIIATYAEISQLIGAFQEVLDRHAHAETIFVLNLGQCARPGNRGK